MAKRTRSAKDQPMAPVKRRRSKGDRGIIIGNTRYSCVACKKGHRVATCRHNSNKVMFEVNKPGRPAAEQQKAHQCRCIHQGNLAKCWCMFQGYWINGSEAGSYEFAGRVFADCEGNALNPTQVEIKRRAKDAYNNRDQWPQPLDSVGNHSMSEQFAQPLSSVGKPQVQSWDAQSANRYPQYENNDAVDIAVADVAQTGSQFIPGMPSVMRSGPTPQQVTVFQDPLSFARPDTSYLNSVAPGALMNDQSDLYDFPTETAKIALAQLPLNQLDQQMNVGGQYQAQGMPTKKPGNEFVTGALFEQQMVFFDVSEDGSGSQDFGDFEQENTGFPGCGSLEFTQWVSFDELY